MTQASETEFEVVEKPARSGRQETAGALLLGLVLLLLIGAQVVAGTIGLDAWFGPGWAGVALVFAFFAGFTLPLSVGAFYCAAFVWGWHWALALAFVAPGLLVALPWALCEDFKALAALSFAKRRLLRRN